MFFYLAWYWVLTDFYSNFLQESSWQNKKVLVIVGVCLSHQIEFGLHLAADILSCWILDLNQSYKILFPVNHPRTQSKFHGAEWFWSCKCGCAKFASGRVGIVMAIRQSCSLSSTFHPWHHPPDIHSVQNQEDLDEKTLKSSWQKTHSLVSQMWVDVESISSSTFNLSKENVWYKEPNLWSEILKLLQLYTLRISSLSWRVFPDILAFRLLWNTLIQQQTLKVLRQCCSMAKTAKAIEF